MRKSQYLKPQRHEKPSPKPEARSPYYALRLLCSTTKNTRAARPPPAELSALTSAAQKHPKPASINHSRYSGCELFLLLFQNPTKKIMKTTFSILAAIFIIVGGVMSTTPTVTAQCSCPPSDPNWYPNVPWSQTTGSIIVLKNGIPCTVYVTFCYRTIGLTAPFTEIYSCQIDNRNNCFPPGTNVEKEVGDNQAKPQWSIASLPSLSRNATELQSRYSRLCVARWKLVRYMERLVCNNVYSMLR
jgi:hypothetical protein